MVRVHDVRQFPGHIACDAGSRSEIVVPVVDWRGQVCLCCDQVIFPTGFYFPSRERERGFEGRATMGILWRGRGWRLMGYE